MLIGSAIIVAIIIFTALISAIFLDGQTFGQRCDHLVQPNNPDEWNKCVANLKSTVNYGGKIL